METVAVYFEPIIRTYGFDVKAGLTLARVAVSAAVGLNLTALVAAEDAAGVDLIMATAGPEPDGELAVWVVVDAEAARVLTDATDAQTYPVDVVHFHGPHFGDRYGIAAAALAALASSGPAPLAVGCTGASVYLSVDAGQGERAVANLRSAFTTPGAKDGGTGP